MEIKIFFRSPDWRKQNGFVLFYEFNFKKSQSQKNISVSEHQVSENFRNYFQNFQNHFCEQIKTRKWYSESNVECFDESEVNPACAASNFTCHRDRIKREIAGDYKCNIKTDPDFCGFRMLKLKEMIQTLLKGQRLKIFQDSLL